MSNNPYAAPNSDVSGAREKQTRLCSPMQAASGTPLGGPVGLIYFLYANFDALGNEQLRKNTIIYGAMLTWALLLIIAAFTRMVSERSFYPFTLTYYITAHTLHRGESSSIQAGDNRLAEV